MSHIYPNENSTADGWVLCDAPLCDAIVDEGEYLKSDSWDLYRMKEIEGSMYYYNVCSPTCAVALAKTGLVEA
ncbi:hypothetical protein SEA_CAMERICO_7 [Gordonia phage Camerico]|nr:hypothetical protein SEA_CAMERICO_7 [Gordonia phage Camerico]